MLYSGTYVARAVEGQLGHSKQGTERVAVRFEIVEPADVAGQSIIWDGWLTEKAFDRTVESLRAAGLTGDDLATLDGLGSQNVELVLAEEEYQGEVRTKVKWVNRLGGGPGRLTVGAMDADAAKSFAARMRSRVAGVGKPAGAPAAPPARAKAPARTAAPAPAPLPVADEDIPF